MPGPILDAEIAPGIAHNHGAARMTKKLVALAAGTLAVLLISSTFDPADARSRGGAKNSTKLVRLDSSGKESLVSRSFLDSDPLMALSVLPCVLMGCPTTGRP